MLYVLVPPLTVVLLGGCAVNPNFQGTSPSQVQSAQSPLISTQISRSAQPTVTMPAATAPSNIQTQSGWAAAQQYVESVVTCKNKFTLQKMNRTIGTASVDMSVSGANKKGGDVVLTPKKPFAIMGLQVKEMQFDAKSEYLVVVVSTAQKAAVAALNSRKYKMVPGGPGYEKSMTHRIIPKNGEESQDQIVVEKSYDKAHTAVFCGPFFMD